MVTRLLPGTEPSAEPAVRRFFYIEQTADSTVDSILTGVMQQAMAAGETQVAILGECATITLPDNTVLQGVSFKTQHPAVESAIQSFTQQRELVFGEVSGSALRLSNGESIPLHLCTVAFTD